MTVQDAVVEHFSKLLLVGHVKVRASSLRAKILAPILVAALHAGVLAPIRVGLPVIHAHLHAIHAMKHVAPDQHARIHAVYPLHVAGSPALFRVYIRVDDIPAEHSCAVHISG